MRKKILIYIDSDYQIRNYLTNESFEALESPDYEVVIYANNNVNQKHILHFEKKFKGYLQVNTPTRTNLRRKEVSILMVKFINRSTTFKFRLMRAPKKSAFKLRMYSLPIISNILLFIFRTILGENKVIKDVLLKERPDLVIMPSTVMEASLVDFLVSCKKMRIKSLFLIDNWDNLSSKTVFPILPSYLGVWGEQSVEHAVRIHKFPKERVFCIGTARFDSYVFNTNELDKPYGFDYVLFTGQSLKFDEISPLKILDYYMIKNNIKDIKIVYRPHPYRDTRKCFDFFMEADFKNVMLDKQIRDYYYYSKTNYYDPNHVNPALEYYPALFKYALFTISPLTTMIIEAAIMNKFILVLAYDDGYHFENPKNALKNCEHFFGIETIRLFKFCYNFDDLPDIFSSLLNQVRNTKKNGDLREDLKYIIEIPKEKYSLRLKRIVDQIFVKY